MSSPLLTVEAAASALNLHPKTVLRHIREGRLQASRVGKAYRITQAQLNAFAGQPVPPTSMEVRATCIVDVPDLTPEQGQRIAGFAQSAALAAGVSGLYVETAFDPLARNLKLIILGPPGTAGHLLEMIDLQMQSLK